MSEEARDESVLFRPQSERLRALYGGAAPES